MKVKGELGARDPRTLLQQYRYRCSFAMVASGRGVALAHYYHDG